MLTGVIVLLGVIAAVGIFYTVYRNLKPELTEILSELESTVVRLETFVDTKTAEIATHAEQIALHTNHIQLKQADKDRAARVRDRLNELIQ